MDVASLILSLYDIILKYEDIVFGFHLDKQKFPDFSVTYNWIKQNIFWDLPYWKTNVIHYYLDIMHVKENAFDNIFNIVMNVKEKTNDNMKARMGLALNCDGKNIELLNDELCAVRFKFTFISDKNT